MGSLREEVKVLGAWASSYVIRPRVALNLKGVMYEYIEENLDAKSELLLKSNPIYKKVPVLVHEGKSVCESMIIVEYIDEEWSVFEPAILPLDPYDRAVARFWASYVDDKWFQSLYGIILGTTEDAKTAVSQAFEVLEKLEEVFVKNSKGKAYFNGDTLGYLDIAFGSYLGWLRAAQVNLGIRLLDEKKTPQLVRWAKRFAAHEAVKGLFPETEKLIECIKMLKAKLNCSPQAN